MLGVPISTPSVAVYGDCGRYLVKIFALMNCIKYWLKITEMPADRLMRASYDMIKALSHTGRITQASKIKVAIFSLGFDEVCFQQGVDNSDLFFGPSFFNE